MPYRPAFVFLILLLVTAGLYAAPPKPSKAAVAADIRVLTDAADDISSIDAWIASAVKDGMSDKDKVFLAWETVVEYRHHDVMPKEFLGLGSDSCCDAIKLFNSYGYCTGIGAQCSFLQLLRRMNIPARAWSVYRWGVVEAFYDNAWHYFDPGMICYYTKPDGTVAGVEEIAAGLKEWYAAHPDYLDQDQKMRDFMKDPGIAAGPEILRVCPTLDERGGYPLNFFGWYTTMLVFNGKNETPFLYEELHTGGHRVNITLHRGESLTRNWGNTGLHVNMFDGGRVPETLNAKVGSGPLYYTPRYGDTANGRIGNGTLVYNVPLDSSLPAALLISDNITCGDSRKPGARAADPSRPGVMVFSRACGYVFLSGTIELDAAVGPNGSISIEVSDDNGRSYAPAGMVETVGPRSIDIGPAVIRKYSYLLKFTLNGKGTQITGLKMHNDFQHSQRPLPALTAGPNTVRFSTGPAEGTVTVESTGLKFGDKQPTYADHGVTFANIDTGRLENNGLIIPNGTGSVTVPFETPGDLVRLRFGCQYRAGLASENWAYQVSFDDGKTFQTVETVKGPHRFNSKYVTVDKVPPGTRKALARFTGTARGSLIMFGFRCDADYSLPGSGTLPVQVTYTWEENGQEKKDIRTITKPQDTYEINCGVKPVMKAIVLSVE